MCGMAPRTDSAVTITGRGGCVKPKPALQISLLSPRFCGTLPHLESCLSVENLMRYITVFFVLATSLVCGVPVGWAEPPSARVALEKPAPDFALTLFSGEKVHLTDFRGKVVVLNFWHSG